MQANLQEAVLSLRDNPEDIPPDERRNLVKQLADAMLCRELEQDGAVSDLLDQLAGDPDWSVRLEVARMVHLLSDETCSRLVARFRGDCNRYVRSHAERSLARQRKARQTSSRKRNESSSYGDQLDQLERQHGKRLAAKVRSLADQRYAMLASAVVHDVRSILTTLSPNVAALSRDVVDSARVRSMQEDVGYLRRTMEAMEQFSKELPVQRHPEDLTQIIAQAVEKARGGVGQQGHDHTAVQITVSAHRSIHLRVARQLMVLALTNVIQNAIEAFATHDQDVIAAG
ncbi:MAG: HEAT repeat domain-containing protein, partial [Pirellulales bacterium]